MEGEWDVQGYSAPFNRDLLESWAFACPVGSSLLAAWFAEFDGAITGPAGAAAYCADLLRQDPPVLGESLRAPDRLPYLCVPRRFHSFAI
jgi:hypothetical protein